MTTSQQSGPFAHSPNEAGEWHPLAAHSAGAANRARRHAQTFGAGGWGHLGGLWHDLGKYARDWQSFIQAAGSSDSDAPAHGPDHSSAGAIHAAQGGSAALPLQFAIAGHHGGLADRYDLAARLKEKQPRYEATVGEVPTRILDREVPPLPEWITSGPSTNPDRMRALEMFTRMLFSCVVDADFLDTEAHFEAGKPQDEQKSRDGWPSLSDYPAVLDAHLEKLTATSPDTEVNRWRTRVLAWCRTASQERPGAFSLTVPTGGGKTLTSLAFALHHALGHGQERIIIALPFTSIIDQTASVLGNIFESLGEDILVEHHSSLEPTKDTRRNKLASENWDAPLIVTTQVQLFNSLFARKASRCRKLHNLTNSVIILDEVQSLPSGMLAPILDVLQELVTHYRTTVLLTTATQPGFHTRMLGTKKFRGFDPRPREIVPSESMGALFDGLRRVAVHWPEREEPITWNRLAHTALAHEQVMLITHLRADAVALWEAIRDQGDNKAIHLSALMCPAHRREVLAKVKQKLKSGDSCRLVTTQLIEAGVDIDFPVVYRAMAGLESLAQSAGRCNREGSLPTGDFFIYNAPTEPPILLRHHKAIAQIMRNLDDKLDLTAPATFQAYYDRLYASGTDVRSVQALREALRFEKTADEARLIRDETQAIAIPYGPAGQRALARLRQFGPSRWTLRALQPFTVSVYPRALAKLRQAGDVVTHQDVVHELVEPRRYDPVLGLRSD